MVLRKPLSITFIAGMIIIITALLTLSSSVFQPGVAPAGHEAADGYSMPRLCDAGAMPGTITPYQTISTETMPPGTGPQQLNNPAGLPVIGFSPGSATIPEGSSGSVTVQLSEASATDVLFNLSTQNLTALSGRQYVAISRQYTIPAGETNLSVSVTTLNDDAYSSPDRQFRISIVPADNNTEPGTTSVTVTIAEASQQPTVIIQSPATTIVEGSAGSVTLQMSGKATSDVTVSLATSDITGHAGTNYQAVSHQFTIPAGSVSATVPLQTLDDHKYSEPDFQFGIAIIAVGGPAGSGTQDNATVTIGEISPKPVAGWQSTSQTINEGSGGSLTIGLSGAATSELVVRVTTVNGTALAGTGFEAIDGQFTIPAGQTSVQVPVYTLNDNLYSGTDLQFGLSFAIISGPATPGSIVTTVKIGESSARPLVGWQSASIAIPEGTTSQAVLQMTNAATSDVTINVTTANGTAHSGADFMAISQQYIIPAGQTSVQVPVTVLDDNKYSNPDLLFSLGIAGIAGPADSGTTTSSVTITESSPMPGVSWQSASAAVSEGSSGSLVLALSSPATTDVKVSVNTANGTARSGINYNAVSGTIYTIAAGSTTVSVPFTTINDNKYSSPDLMFTATLSVASGPATTGSTTTASVSITESSPRRTVAWQWAASTINEGTAGSLTLQLSGLTTSDVIVNVTTANGTALSGTDYTAISQQYTIPAGSASITVPVTTLNNNKYSSPNLTFSVTMALVSGPADAGSTTVATVSVGEVSARPTVRWQSATSIITEGTNGSLDLQLSGAATSDVVLNVATANGTALSGRDYTAISQQYTIPAGSASVSVPITTLDDGMYSTQNNQLTITLTVASGPATAGAPATSTITITEASPMPTVGWQSATFVAPESSTGTISANLSCPATSDIKIVVTTSDGTAHAGEDYNAIGRQFTIPAGSPGIAIPVTTLDDHKYSDPDLHFTAAITVFSGPATVGTIDTATVNIGEMNTTPHVSFRSASATIAESTTSSVIVQIDGVTTSDVTFNVTTANGTAMAGRDYSAISRQYTISAGSVSTTVPVTTLNDNLYGDQDPQFTLALAVASGPALTGDQSSMTITVHECSPQPTIGWEQPSIAVPEGSSGSLTARLSGPATTDTTISITTADGTAHTGVGYTAIAGDTYIIPAGTTSVIIPVATLNDGKYSDPNLTFSIVATVVSGPAVHGSATATVNIGEASPRPVVSWQSGSVTVPEGTTGALNVTLSGLTTSDVRVVVVTSDGTAHAGEDYNAIGRQFTIPAGSPGISIPVITLNDSMYIDQDLQFNATLSLAGGPASPGSTTLATVSVGEGSPRPTVGWSATAATINEGSSGTLTLQLSGAVKSNVIIGVATANGTARSGTQYTSISHQYTIPAGQTSISVPVATLNDGMYSSPDLTFDVISSIVSGPVDQANATSTVSIHETGSRPSVRWQSSSLSISEGASSSLNLQLTGAATSDVVLNVATANGTAVSGTNYTAVSQQFTIPAGQTIVAVPLATVDDHMYTEINRSYTVSFSLFSGPVNATSPTTATITVREANPRPTVGWQSPEVPIAEGTVGMVPVQLSGPATTGVTVIVISADGTAAAGADYIAIGHRFTIPAGQTTVNVPVTTLDDGMYSNDLQFTAALSLFTGPADLGITTETVNITEASPQPSAGWSSGTASIYEGTTRSLLLQQSGLAKADTVINVQTLDGTAQAGTDYTAVNQQYTIPAGQTSVYVPISTMNNGMADSPDLQFTATCSIASGLATAGSTTTTVTLLEDGSGVISFNPRSVIIPEATEGKVTIELTSAAASDVDIQVTSSNGTAHAGTDYDTVNGIYTILAGQSSIDIPVTTREDGKYSSPDLQFGITATVVSGPAAGSDGITVSIGENRPIPTMGWQSPTASLPEDASGTLNIQLTSATTSDIVVFVATSDATAHMGTDYNRIGQRFTIPAGQTSLSIPATTLDDNAFSSPDKVFNADLTLVTGPATMGTSREVVTITEKDTAPAAGFTAGASTIYEGSTGYIPVQLSYPATSNVIVNVVTSDGTARAGTDYTAFNQQFTIPAGQTSINVPVITRNNGIYCSPNLQFSLSLSLVSGPATAGIQAKAVNVGEASPRPTVGWQYNSTNITEGTAGMLNLVLSGIASTDVIVNVATADGTARAGTGYTAISQQFTIPAGQTIAPVSITTLSDGMYSDHNQQFTISLGTITGPATAGANATATVTVDECTGKPTVGWQRTSQTIPEDAEGTLTVELSNPSTTDIVVIATTSDGTARAGTDYEAIGQRFTIPAGTSSIPITLTTLDDGMYSDTDLQFGVTLSIYSGPAIMGTATEAVNIGELSPRPTVSWQRASVAMPEGVTDTASIVLSGPATTDVVVSVATSNGTALAGRDYSPISRQYTIAARSTSLSVPVTTIDDEKYSSPDLQFNATLTLISGPATTGSSLETISIADSSPRPTVSWQPAATSITEEASGMLTLKLSGVTTSAVVVNVATANGTARAGIDYTAVSQQFTIPAGQTTATVPVETLNDHKYSSPDLQFTAGLSIASGPANAGTATATVSIGETDPRPMARWQYDTVSVPEGTTSQIYAELTGPATSDVVVMVNTGDGTAKVGTDYNRIGQRFTIPAGSTSVAIPITTLNDSKYSDPDLQFNATLSFVSGPAMPGSSLETIGISDSSPRPTVTWQSSPITIAEGSAGTLTLKLSGVTTSAVVVNVTTADGTAHAGVNYVTISQNFTIPAGQTSLSVPVTTLNDGKYSSPNLSFSTALSIASGPADAGASVATVNIGEGSARPTVKWQATALTISEGNSGNLTVSLTGAATSDVVVNVATANGTIAKSGINYVAISQQFTIPAGSTTVNVPVITLNDSKYSNPNPTFTAVLSLVGGPATLGSATATLTIGEGSTKPTVGWQTTSAAIGEASSGTLTILLSGPATSAVSVRATTVDGTAHAGTNYAAINQVYNIPAGSTTVNVTATTLNDGKYSNPDLGFNISLGSLTGPASLGTALQTVSIIESSARPTVQWQITSATITEGGSGNLVAQLSGPATTAVVIRVTTADGTAHAGTEYTAVSQQYTIPAGSTTVSVPVATLNNNKYSNPNLMFTAGMSLISGPADLGTDTVSAVTIQEASTRPLVRWQASSATIPEGTTGTAVVQLTGPATTDIVVGVATGDDTAHAGVNYAAIGDQYTIPAGQTSVNVLVTTLNDNKYSSPDLRFTLGLTLVSGPATLGTATETINAGEVSARPAVRWQTSSATIPEGSSVPQVIQLSGVTTSDVVVNVTTSNGTARAGTGYTAISQQITIPAGQTTVSIPVETLNDNSYSSPDLQFSLGLTLVSGPATLGTATETITIGEASALPAVEWQQATISTNEGTGCALNAVMSGPATSAVVINVNTSNGTAHAGIDYTAISRQYTIPAGSTNIIVPVATLDDSKYSDHNVDFTVTLSMASGPASAGTGTAATVTVVETAPRPTVSWQLPSATIAEASAGSITVQLSGPATAGVTVNVATEDGTAHAGTEYTAISQQYTIPAGQTTVSVPVATLNDSKYSNPDLQFGVRLGSVSGPADLGTSVLSTITISEICSRPFVGWAPAAVTVSEGSSGVAVVQLGGPATSDVVVHVKSQNGTAHTGIDYVAVDGDYTIPAGQTTVSVPLNTLNDSKYSNPDLQFSLDLTLVNGPATLGTANKQINIGETGNKPTIEWQASTAMIAEGSADTMTILLSGPATTDVTVRVTTADDTAYAGSDYTAIDTTYTIPAGQTSVSVPVATLNDGKYSNPDLQFTANVALVSGPASVDGATATVTIAEASQMPAVSFATGSLTIPEGSTGTITVQLGCIATSDVTLRITTVNGTATAGTGFSPFNSTLVIPAGSQSATVNVATLDDSRYSDPDLWFSLNMSAESGPIIGNATARIVIGEAAATPTVSFATNGTSVPEGSQGSMEIQLSGVTTTDVTVNVTTANGTAHSGIDYRPQDRQYVIPAGSTNVTVIIDTLDDSRYSNPDLWFNLSIAAVRGPATAGQNTTACMRISESDNMPTLGWSCNTTVIRERSNGSLVMQLSRTTTYDIAVRVTTANGTAVSDRNYVPIDREYVIPANSWNLTVDVSVLSAPGIYNPGFSVTLSPANSTALTDNATVNVSIRQLPTAPPMSIIVTMPSPEPRATVAPGNTTTVPATPAWPTQVVTPSPTKSGSAFGSGANASSFVDIFLNGGPGGDNRYCCCCAVAVIIPLIILLLYRRRKKEEEKPKEAEVKPKK